MPEPSWLKPIFGSHPIGDIPGDPAAVRTTARAYEVWSGRLNDAGTAIKKIDAEAWQGAAADAFRVKFEVEPKRWFDASDRVLEAARALETYAYTLEWAQREVAEARAAWTSGHEASRVGAARNASTGALVLWQQQEYAERMLGAPPRPAYPGDRGAGMRSAALWRMDNAKKQHDGVGDDAAAVLESAADDLPIHRNFLESVGEFIGGGLDNLDALREAMTDLAGTTQAMGQQAQLWMTDQRAATANLVDANGLEKNQPRWFGSMLLGFGVGRAGRYLRPSYLPPHLHPGYYDKYRASGATPLPGKSGGDAVTSVRGENLEITPEIRERASYLNPYRMDHIIERHGPDTPYPDSNTTQFPESWSHDKIFEAVQHVASNPSFEWSRRSGDPGELFDTTSDYVLNVLKEDMAPARFTVNGFYEGIPIRVSVEPYGEGIISGFIPN